MLSISPMRYYMREWFTWGRLWGHNRRRTIDGTQSRTANACPERSRRASHACTSAL